MRLALRSTALILFALAVPGIPASSQPKPPPSVEAAIRYAANEHGLSEAKFQRVAYCESTYRADAVGGRGKYLGLMQHSKTYMPGRVKQFNEWARRTGRPTMNGDWPAAIDSARLAGWMVRQDGGKWTADWPNCGKR